MNFRRVLLAAVLLAFLAPPAIAQEAEQFTTVRRTIAAADGIEARPGTLATHRVRINIDALSRARQPGSQLRLAIGSESSVLVAFHSITSDEFNGDVWTGRVVGDDFSTVIVVLDGNRIAGSMAFDGRMFEIRARGARGDLIEYDPGSRPEGNDVVFPNPSAESPSPQLAMTSPRAPDDAVIDVIALYLPQAAKDIGGKRAMKAAWKLAIAAANSAFDSSKVRITMRLLLTKKVSYSGSLGDARGGGLVLNALQAMGDGHMDNVHAVREKFGADMVTLAVPQVPGTSDICGRGFLGGFGSGLRPSDEQWQFNIVRSDCVSGYAAFTFPHEAGHNLGLRHNREDATPPPFGAYDHSYGHRVPGKFRTVMSYSCTADGLSRCDTIVYFSNPKVKHDRKPTGVKSGAKAADNGRSLNLDGQTAAAFRACTKKCDT